jgi:hypothetical protein
MLARDNKNILTVGVLYKTMNTLKEKVCVIASSANIHKRFLFAPFANSLWRASIELILASGT